MGSVILALVALPLMERNPRRKAWDDLYRKWAPTAPGPSFSGDLNEAGESAPAPMEFQSD